MTAPAASLPAVELAPAPLIDLSTWLANTYNANNAPCVNTVRRWVRENRIQPPPEKQGRAYFFHPRARYVRPKGDAK
jgi:hypothetical protein